jgi:hypothetical protein
MLSIAMIYLATALDPRTLDTRDSEIMQYSQKKYPRKPKVTDH